MPQAWRMGFWEYYIMYKNDLRQSSQAEPMINWTGSLILGPPQQDNDYEQESKWEQVWWSASLKKTGCSYYYGQNKIGYNFCTYSREGAGLEQS